MAVDYNEFDSRIDAIVAAFAAARTDTLGRELPKPVTVHKGPHRWQLPGAGDFAVFVSRGGMPSVAYDMGQKTSDITLTVDVAAATYCPAGDDEDMEGYVNVFGANVAAVLFSLVRKTGTDGWYKGIMRRSDAITLRDEEQQTVELEVFQFDVTFEVDYSA